MEEGKCRSCSLHMSPIRLPERVSETKNEDYPVRRSLWQQIENAAKLDIRDQFVDVVNGLTGEEEFLHLLHHFVFSFDSANCAAAILAGETDGMLNLTTDLSHDGTNAVLEAAKFCAPRVLTLLLSSGFVVDASGSGFRLGKNILPLTLALQMTRRRISENAWGRNSAVKLVDLLCDMRRCLETVRLLAYNTKEIKREFFYYLRERQMVEVGALLMVATETLLSPSISEEEDAFGFKSIVEMRNFLSATRPKSSDGLKDEVLKVDEELAVLLEIFDKIGNKLAAYVRLDEESPGHVSLHVVSLLKDAGFNVSTEDTYSPTFFSTTDRPFESSVVRRVPVDGCNKRFCDSRLLPSWFRSKALSPLGGKSDSSSHLSRRLFSTAPLLSMTCLAPAESLAEGVLCISSQKRYAVLMTALKKGLRHI